MQDRVRAALATPSVPLPNRERMEGAFGRDFGDVRVHAGGALVASLLDALKADGAAIGRDLLYRDANPDEELVAHELAHVVQGEGGMGSAATSTPGDSAERDADAAAQAVVRGETPEVDARATGEVQGGFWSGVASFASSVVDTVGEVASAASEVVTDTVSAVSNTVAAATSNAIETVSGAATSAVETVSGLTGDAISAGQSYLSDAWSYAQPTVSAAVDAGSELVGATVDQVTGSAPAEIDEGLDAGEISDRLLYGVGNWVISDQDAQDVMASLEAMSDTERSETLAGLTAEQRERLVDNYPGDIPASVAMYLEDAQPDAASLDGVDGAWLYGDAGLTDVTKDGELVVDGADVSDIKQGILGDCWLLASLGSVVQSDPHFVEEAIIPQGDGSFNVRLYNAVGDPPVVQEFWVVVDGLVPSDLNVIRYARTGEDGEYWPLIIEKAVTKLYDAHKEDESGYDAMVGDDPRNAYFMLTGDTGTREEVEDRDSEDLWNLVSDASASNQPMTASIDIPGPGGHAVTVLSVTGEGDARVVTIRDQAQVLDGLGQDLQKTIPWSEFVADYDAVTLGTLGETTEAEAQS